jgi:hypothetical protein
MVRDCAVVRAVCLDVTIGVSYHSRAVRMDFLGGSVAVRDELCAVFRAAAHARAGSRAHINDRGDCGSSWHGYGFGRNGDLAWCRHISTSIGTSTGASRSRGQRLRLGGDCWFLRRPHHHRRLLYTSRFRFQLLYSRFSFQSLQSGFC